MNFWRTLGIKKTTDKSEIKKAYRTKLKKTRPDEDEDGFIKLRSAYEAALEYAEYNYEEYEEREEDEEEHGEYDDYEDYEDFVEPDEYTTWNIRLIELWNDLGKRYDAECWRKLLYEDAPYKLKYYEQARTKIKNLIHNDKSPIYLPVQVYKVIDKFFAYTTRDEECIHLQRPHYQRWINIKARISAEVDFRKLHKSVDPDTVDDMLYKFDKDVSGVILGNELKFIHNLELKYLPLETLKISLAFDEYTDEEFENTIELLKNEYGEDIEFKLLTAERMIYNGDDATYLLEDLYEWLPRTDVLFTYRLMNCFKSTVMYYKAYMLTKHVLWMSLNRTMNLTAEEISNLIESEYKGLSDTEHIQMCRMYLRSYRKKEAVKILTKVKDTDSWEYHMARALAYFNEKDITPGIESYEILANYPKENLHFLQILEWEELQGRYYFEKKEYAKCIAKCNELLGKYPESYPIFILRAYADRALNRNCSNYEGMFDLWRIYGERPEVALFELQVFADTGHWQDAENVISDAKDKCELEYGYTELKNFKGKHDELKKAWLKYLNLIASKNFYIDVKNKYGFMDLETILTDSISLNWEVAERKKYVSSIKKIYKSQNNDFGKELSRSLYYYLLMDDKNMLKEAKRCIRNATDMKEKEDALVELVGSYAMNAKFEELDNEIMNFEKENPVCDEILQRVYMQATMFCRFINEYERGIYYGHKFGNNMLSMYSGDLLAEMTQCYYYMGRKDSAYFHKAIDTADKLFSIWGRYYVESTNVCPYIYVAYAYAELGQVDKAMESLEFMYKYTKKEFYRYDFNTYAFRMYVRAHMPEKAYEYVLKSKKDGGYIQLFREELGDMLLGNYGDAYSKLITRIENDPDDDPNGDLILCAMHSKYFMDGFIDMELVQDIKVKLEKWINMPNGDTGANFFHLAHIYNILGDEKETKKYEKLAYNYSDWESLDDKEMYIQVYTLWTYWYNKEYEKAYQYCKNNIIFDNYFEAEYLEYFLKEMFEKSLRKEF